MLSFPQSLPNLRLHLNKTVAYQLNQYALGNLMTHIKSIVLIPLSLE